MKFRDVHRILRYRSCDIARDLGVSQVRVHYLIGRHVVPKTDLVACRRLLPMLKERRYLLDVVIKELESK
jgi:hypothetical protein